MPLPTPNKNEKKSDFIGRCVSDLSDKKEFDSSDQRVAVCNKQWEEKKKSSKASAKINNDEILLF